MEGQAEPGAAGAGVAVLLILGLAHGLEAFGQGEGVAVVATRGYAVTAGRGIPGRLCPLDAGSVAHGTFL